MSEFNTTPICHLIYGNRKSTGWMCSPNGYIMGPGHLFTDKNVNVQTIDFRSNISAAYSCDVYYKNELHKASLVYAYKNTDEHMDFAVLKMEEPGKSFDYYPVTIQCAQKASIHMAGYGDIIGDNALDTAEGHYVSKVHFKKTKDYYLLKIICEDAVQKGFSGSPVFVDELNAVVGMQINASKMAFNPNNSRHAEKKSIFAVPMKLILQKFPFMRNILVLEGIGESGCILPKQLIKDISDGNCILFTGAGCSLDAGLPRWKHLIEALLDETYNRVPPDENTKQELQKLLNEGKLLVVARYCRAKLREAGFIRFLREQLGNYNPENAETHKILSTIKFKAILTTNYDPLTEDFYSDEKHPVYTAKDFENSSLDVENITPIIKIHGSLERPESIILTSTDIRNAIFGNNNFRERLKELFRNSTVLFIGYSFDDPNISMLLQDLLTSQPIETRMHYAIMPNTNSIMNDYLLEDMNVFVLSFKTSWNSFEPLHKVLNDLVASLPPHAFKI